MAANADETFTMADGAVDATRALYLKITSAVSLTTTRTVTLAPSSLNKVWIIDNATSGSQSIIIKQGSGATVTVATGKKVMVVTEGAGAGSAVLNVTPDEASAGTVTSVAGTGTVNGITLTGTVTSSGNLTLGGTLSGVNLTSQVTGTLPIASGGTGSTSTQFVALTTNVTGTLPIANGGTNATTAAGARVSILPDITGNAGKALIVNGGATDVEWVVTPGVGTVTSVGGTGTVNGITLTGTVTSSGDLTLGGTLSGVDLTSQITGTLPVANGGTGLASPGTAGNVLTSNGTTWTSAASTAVSNAKAYFFASF
jgi:hypothetical protein